MNVDDVRVGTILNEHGLYIWQVMKIYGNNISIKLVRNLGSEHTLVAVGQTLEWHIPSNWTIEKQAKKNFPKEVL